MFWIPNQLSNGGFLCSAKTITYNFVGKWTFLTAIFRITRTLLKSTATTKYVFCCRQSHKRTSQETSVRFNGVKRSRLSVVIGRFRSNLFVSFFSRFVCCRHNYDWRQRKTCFAVAVDLAEFACFWKSQFGRESGCANLASSLFFHLRSYGYKTGIFGKLYKNFWRYNL